MRRMRIRFLHVVLGGLSALALVGLLPVSGAAAAPESSSAATPPVEPGWGPTPARAATNKAVTDRIHADRASLASQGVELTEWGPDAASGKVKVYLTHYSAAARRVLQARYGSDIVVATQSMPRPTALDSAAEDSAAEDGAGLDSAAVDSTSVDRRHDVAPFFGGDFILVVDNLQFCTSGPIVRNAKGQLRMITAGLCAPLGSAITTTTSPAVFMGNVNRRRYCGLCIDAAVVSGRYKPIIWGGGPSGANAYCEDGAKTVQVGGFVALDGARTGEIRKVLVQAVNQVIVFSDGLARLHITKVTKQDVDLVRPRDRGGPVIQHEGTSNHVKVAGIIIGGDFESFDVAYYEQQAAINRHFDVTVPKAC